MPETSVDHDSVDASMEQPLSPEVLQKLSTPASWTQGCAATIASGVGAAEQVEALNGLFDQAYPGVAAAAAEAAEKASGADDASGPAEDPQLQKLRQAAQEGFELKSSVGSAWAKALKKCAELRQDYINVGKSYKAQRDFRQQWAANNYQLKLEQKRKTQITTSEDALAGTYEPMQVIWEREGKDSGAITATLNYVNECIARTQKGELNKQRPWVAWNSFTKRHEFLYVKRSCRDSFAEQWEMRTQWVQRPGNNAASSNQQQSAEDPPPGAGNGQNGQAGGKRGRQPQQNNNDDNPPAPPPPPKKTKNFNEDFARAQKLKAQMNAASASAVDLMGVITTQACWAWANNPATLGALSAAKDAVDKFKNISDFFKAWVVQEKFAPYARKAFDEETLKAEFVRLSKLAKALSALEVEVTTIKAMHNARVNAAVSSG